MNKLWIRIAVIFSIVIILISTLPYAIFLIAQFYGLVQLPFPDLPSLSDVDRVVLEEATARAMQTQYFRSILFSIITGAVVGLIASRAISRPLAKLSDEVERLGREGLDQRVQIDRGSDEVQAVGDAINQMAAQLQQAEKARQGLLADVAHELRTPLTVIQGNLRGILDDVFPLTKDEIGRLFDQSEHLTHLVNDLHELAQAEAHQLPLHKSELNVVKMMDETATWFRPIAEEKGVSLQLELLGKIEPLFADPNRVRQAVNNLVSNAIRYTNQGGQVTLQTEALDSEHLAIRVIDTGIGMSPDQLPRVFDRFYRTDSSRQRHDDQSGTGLGLAIVRAIVENHGGRVGVHSDGPGHGSRFEIVFPYAPSRFNLNGTEPNTAAG